ncbi:MAG: HAD family phosphatase [Deltaproteobacteria bacterium]|nr:HAD family phosphatase [Deltaproteobacteria bacterium]
MIRALIFDFNGVVVDDEPVHFQLFQKTLEAEGIALDQKDYYEKYLGYDDYECFEAILKDRQKAFDAAYIETLIQKKSKFYEEVLEEGNLFVPGVLEFIRKNSDKYFMAIVSGALRSEIVSWLEKAAIQENFQVIIAAEDVRRSKPDPEGYEQALYLLNRDFTAPLEIIFPQECVVFEDSMWGLQAAHEAKMRRVGVSTSYPSEQLKDAEFVVGHFLDLTMEKLLEKLG